MARVFIIRPFGEKNDSDGRKINFNEIQSELISQAIKNSRYDLSGDTTQEIVEAGNIREDMFALILEADLVICDITIHNANVFYELGVRHALRKRHTILIKGTPSADKTPFDLSTDRYLAFDLDRPCDTCEALTRMINSTLSGDREPDSPVFRLLDRLPELDVKQVQVVPLDFREDVQRAQSAGSIGWLRLLGREVSIERFALGGLRIVGTAQWDLKDYEGARESWEKIQDIYRYDIDANFALSNIYERLYRERKQRPLLERSDQAIRRVLDSDQISRKQRAEALALGGRNQKTRWREGFETLATVEERRERAMNAALLESYAAYRDAFYQDLNHFYPGLVALQMVAILMDLSGGDAWYSTFDDDEEADNYRKSLKRELKELSAIVPVPANAELKNIPASDPNRFWAEISVADLKFLTSTGNRVIRAYERAVPRDKPFAWDAARGQLALFVDLGVKKELAQQVIDTMDAHFPLINVNPKTETKPVHLIVFAGHQIDAADRPTPRFPSKSEDRAAEMIQARLQRFIGEEHEIRGIASAAPGADILFHEACDELGIATTVCLPMPEKDFVPLAMEDLAWRNRFLKLKENGEGKDREFLELSNRQGLPKWIQVSSPDPWERGNEWVVQMANTSGAGKVTLLALWDGKETGDHRGGTSHIVDLAKKTTSIFVETIDANELLKVD